MLFNEQAFVGVLIIFFGVFLAPLGNSMHEKTGDNIWMSLVYIAGIVIALGIGIATA